MLSAAEPLLRLSTGQTSQTLAGPALLSFLGAPLTWEPEDKREKSGTPSCQAWGAWHCWPLSCVNLCSYWSTGQRNQNHSVSGNKILEGWVNGDVLMLPSGPVLKLPVLGTIPACLQSHSLWDSDCRHHPAVAWELAHRQTQTSCLFQKR